MPKRAERRHQSERVKDRWRREMKGLTRGTEPNIAYPWRWRRGGERILGHVLEWIEYNAVRKAAHPSCDCGHCRGYREWKKIRDKKSLNRGWKPGEDDLE